METSERTLIDLPKIFDIRGNLTVAESLHHVPFNIKRDTGHTTFLRAKAAAVMHIKNAANLSLP